MNTLYDVTSEESSCALSEFRTSLGNLGIMNILVRMICRQRGRGRDGDVSSG